MGSEREPYSFWGEFKKFEATLPESNHPGPALVFALIGWALANAPGAMIGIRKHAITYTDRRGRVIYAYGRPVGTVEGET